MSVGRSLAVALLGLAGHLVEVEADVTAGLPAFVLTGLPDAALVESRDRVRAALRNAGLALADRRVVVNLSPASLPKQGASFDLAVAAALLAAQRSVRGALAAQALHLGELGLDGWVRPVRGVLPAVLAASSQGVRRAVVPAANAAEAALVPGVEVVPVEHLGDLVRAHGGELVAAPPRGAGRATLVGGQPGAPGADGTASADLSDVVGQADALDALRVAAAGGHHLLLTGPPGAGKSMLAARLPGVLPPLSEAEAVEVTAVHSLSGTFDPARGLLDRPPFEAPHHTASAAAVLGGGSLVPSPGAVSRAHRGVLLLDEGPEFDRRVLEGLRQPLEDGEVVIARARGTARFPARFQLVCTSNPCPCGRGIDKGLSCRCTPQEQRRYRNRLSGPLLDRVDLQVTVAPVSRTELDAAERGTSPTPRPTSAQVAAQVAAARGAAAERLRGTPWRCNGEVPGRHLRGPLRLPSAAVRTAMVRLDEGELTLRGLDRVLRVSWTLADLAGRAQPGAEDVERALSWRLPWAVA
ncbi:magnesium chelatase family protein [Quadrisphaera granulorum]|uniref:Magnesium chelatase family protein n=1 Tax=Quadrisphaera granulorum TaxID=317664 RepID=A0A316AF40_9ACTN|nr:YifB family Mg chelatase-like AAA ATPase [Quadrisphaera granulorum]PWJ56405.1 magnesium chelatase family protein [Quadrisphaera granulorum]SZE95039.1 magnesium chelatase family protein [Quadrisphaera granulorum]